MTDDRVLVEHFLQTRSDQAFRDLYRRHAPLMYRLIVRLIGPAGRDAEDALQDAWIRAAERLDQFRWESSLRTWLCGIAANCCRERIRRVEPADVGAPERVSSGEPVPHWQTLDLERAIARLAPGARAVLVLHDLHGYTHEEIAQILDVEPSTSRSQLVRARRALRCMLERT